MGHVKGVAWDPFDFFLASQVWRGLTLNQSRKETVALQGETAPVWRGPEA